MRVNDIGINNRYDSKFSIHRNLWTRDYLFLRFRTPAVAVFNGIESYVEGGSIILYHVNTPQHYYANQNDYADDYIHFYIDNDYPFVAGLNIPFNTLIHMPNTSMITNLLEYIHAEYISGNTEKETSIDFLMKLLLIKISEFLSKDTHSNLYLEYYDILLELRTTVYSHPERNWTVSDMADFCCLSSSYFQVLYKQAFQITCINDVINSKIQNAKSLLALTNYNVKKIALLCGYKNSEYFMRQFKKSTGLTPSHYRKAVFASDNLSDKSLL